MHSSCLLCSLNPFRPFRLPFLCWYVENFESISIVYSVSSFAIAFGLSIQFDCCYSRLFFRELKKTTTTKYFFFKPHFSPIKKANTFARTSEWLVEFTVENTLRPRARHKFHVNKTKTCNSNGHPVKSVHMQQFETFESMNRAILQQLHRASAFHCWLTSASCAYLVVCSSFILLLVVSAFSSSVQSFEK